jgi:hypothetical protein
MSSVFGTWERQAYPFVFEGELLVHTIAGGIPSDPNVARAWLSTKLAGKDDLIQKAVAETMVERGISMEEATKMVNELRHLNGFKRASNGQLVIEGRQLKACLKEAVNVAANAGKITTKGWGNPDNKNYLKGVKAWFPEHVGVVDYYLYLGVTEPTGVIQRFVHTPRGTGIQYEEYIENAKVAFTLETDHDFTEEQWAMIWLTAERMGIGASRSQGFGKFEVTRWDRT